MSEEKHTRAAGTAGEVGEVGEVEFVTPEGVSDAAGAPGTSGAPDAPPGPVRGRRTAVLAGRALLVAAVLGGTGCTVVAVTGADRDPGAPTWNIPKPTARPKTGGSGQSASAPGLSALLLPYGTDGYTRGPDLNEFGSDAVLSGRRATAVRKEALRGLPRTPRRELEKRIDEQRITGVAMRSYLSTDAAGDSTLYADKAFTIGVELTRMASRESVREAATAQASFLEGLEIFRKGPEIGGHDNATCFLPPDEEEEKLDMMICSAYQGDILLSATANGIKPLDTDGVARFLREQLDRIGEPGESV